MAEPLVRPAALAADPSAPEQPCRVPTQLAGTLRVERLVDRLVHDAHLWPAGEQSRQRPADLLRAPALLEVALDERPQLGGGDELPELRPDPATGGAALRPNLFFQAEDGIRDDLVTGVQTCALPI